MSTHRRVAPTVVALACLASLACQPADSNARDTSVLSATAAAAAPFACIIDSVSIGGVRLGMTLDEVRRSLPTARLERVEDGDGVQLVQVTMDTTRLMTLYAGEEEPPIDWAKRVGAIETFTPACRTADGVHPGALVRDVERILGGVTRIVESEIESRQFISFARQPEWLTLRLDYTGIFPDGARQSTTYKDGARIFSIAISSR